MSINSIITGGTTLVGAAGEIFRIISSRKPENASAQHYFVDFQSNQILQIRNITNNLITKHDIF